MQFRSRNPGAQMKGFEAGERVSTSQVVLITAMHVLAFIALFNLTAHGLLLLLLLHFLTGCLGISVGYHRLLSHKSFEVSNFWQAILAFFGVLAFQGGPISWAQFHRAHHRYTNRKGDPHSAGRGFWWSHIGWAFYQGPNGFRSRKLKRLVRDLVGSNHLKFLERHQLVINIFFAALLVIAVGIEATLVAVPLRIVLVWHHTWLVNSLAHGSLPLKRKTDGDPKDIPILALTNYGEGFHKQHHSDPRNPCFSPNMPSLDFGYQIIRVLRFLSAFPLRDKNLGIKDVEVQNGN
jgi:stearoyl-CoA desaturase (delta-9 desaturase)